MKNKDERYALRDLFEIQVKLPTHEHPLKREMKVLPNRGCSGCNKSPSKDKHRRCYYHYSCLTGGCLAYYFHPDCVECLPEIHHPYHPKQPLTPLISVPPNDSEGKCWLCGDKLGPLAYHCSACNFSIEPICAYGKVTPLVVDYKKGHEHTLTLLLRNVLFTCDACGQVSKCCPYVCLQCHFMVHRDCIYLPRIIKITRHPHRLSLVYSRPPEEKYCEICRQGVQWHYGQYLCNKGCAYAIHSKCATRKEVCDGKDLEGLPEETNDETEGLEPFGRIDDKTIHHFCHGEHHLRLDEHPSFYNPSKLCNACILPAYSDPIYNCIQCDDFTIHRKCASLPPKKSLALHHHPLILHAKLVDHSIIIVEDKDEDDGETNIIAEGISQCSACRRLCSGFQYTCHDQRCSFNLDIQCASISEPFIHDGHRHPLFITSIEDNPTICGACGIKSRYVLNCTDCPFSLCFRCVTLPGMIAYKHDEHPFILRCGENTNGPYWCEICEEEINPNKWFYTCEASGVTLHVECAPGNLAYLMPGHRFKLDDDEIEVVPNNQSSRPICSKCGGRCLYTLALKTNDGYLCSY